MTLSDEGKSARKRCAARKEFMRMLADVEADKLDVILFIKLDRWFRSVADYYKVQEILDAHHVTWRATQERYDTETANGRLYINIRLAVAQDESDRDSDRIKFVFQSKLARREAVTGALPLGLKLENKRVVPDPETAPAVRALFRHYGDHRSAAGAARYVREVFGLPLRDYTARRMLRNPLYKGFYRGDPDFCPALVPPEEFDALQPLLAARSPRENQSGRVYLFSGLLFCACCGGPMSGHWAAPRGKEYYLYRCRRAAVHRDCPHRREVNEEALENWLLEKLEAALAPWEVRWTPSPAPARGNLEAAALRRRLERLKALCLEGLIGLEDFRAEKVKLEARLRALPAEKPAPPQAAPPGDLRGACRLLDREGRRALWHSAVQEVRLDGDNRPRLIFRP